MKFLRRLPQHSLLWLIRDMISYALIMLGILVLSTAVLVVFGYMIKGTLYIMRAVL